MTSQVREFTEGTESQARVAALLDEVQDINASLADMDRQYQTSLGQLGLPHGAGGGGLGGGGGAAAAGPGGGGGAQGGPVPAMNLLLRMLHTALGRTTVDPHGGGPEARREAARRRRLEAREEAHRAAAAEQAREQAALLAAPRVQQVRFSPAAVMVAPSRRRRPSPWCRLFCGEHSAHSSAPCCSDCARVLMWDFAPVWTPRRGRSPTTGRIKCQRQAS